MVACLVLALAGFLTFGDKTLGNVLNNFSPDNSMVNVARLCFGLNMLTTLPLEAFVCREVMFTYFYPGEPFNLKLHIIFSTGLVASAMGISLITCDLGAIFELVGATSACTLAYILPPLCYMKLTTRSWRTYVAAAVVGFGTLVLVVSIIQAVNNIIRGECLRPVPLVPSSFSLLQHMGMVSSSFGHPINTVQATARQRNACKGGLNNRGAIWGSREGTDEYITVILSFLYIYLSFLISLANQPLPFFFLFRIIAEAWRG